jgi:chloramphenicol 3-O-phosphotransferase
VPVVTQVIVLNGGSSSGKAGIARCLQATLPQPWIRLGMDGLEGVRHDVQVDASHAESLAGARVIASRVAPAPGPAGRP